MGNKAIILILTGLLCLCYVAGVMHERKRAAAAQVKYEECVKQRRLPLKAACRECAYLLIDEPEYNLPNTGRK